MKKAGYPIAHLDNTNTRKERELILKWFHKTPNAIISSVSILTTGFDEPSIEAIILNRATKSLTLYYQMIGRGSRIFGEKNTFEVIDLGNNFHRFGPWGADLDWQKMFRAPDYYLDAILSDEEIENTFRYEFPGDIKKEFEKSTDTYFDMKKVYIDTIKTGESSKRVLEKSIIHHAKMYIENSEDVFDALILAKLIGEEIIEIEAQIEMQVQHKGQDIDLNIVFEDEHILVITKPMNLVVHPGAGNSDGTVLNALLNHAPEIANVPRAGIVHRLDKDTTGLMVVAKTIPAQTHLVEQLQAREISREYEAVVVGTMVAGGTVDEPIGRHATKRTSMAVRESGKPAMTHYRVKEKFRAHTYIRLKLESGRTHQIRVHMSHLRYPLVGDQAYGGRPRPPKACNENMVNMLRMFRRQALHAIQLELTHPVTGEWLSWQAPLPDDFVELLEVLREDKSEHGSGEV